MQRVITKTQSLSVTDWKRFTAWEPADDLRCLIAVKITINITDDYKNMFGVFSRILSTQRHQRVGESSRFKILTQNSYKENNTNVMRQRNSKGHPGKRNQSVDRNQLVRTTSVNHNNKRVLYDPDEFQTLRRK